MDGTRHDAALEVAREAFIAELLDRKPGDEPYDWDMRLGELEVYRLRRALAAAISAYGDIPSAKASS